MKLIYLDIDGVICTHRACAAIGETGTMDYLDPIACKLVEKLITEFDAQVVISSTWRLSHSKSEMYRIFRCAGHHIIADALHTNWCTPHIKRPDLCRGHEIEQHLAITENHDHITEYVILDDDSDMLAYQLPHFAKCDTYDGLGLFGYEKARRILVGTNVPNSP